MGRWGRRVAVVGWVGRAYQRALSVHRRSGLDGVSPHRSWSQTTAPGNHQL